MSNQNGRNGDSKFASIIYSFLINGEHIDTRKLRLLTESKLGEEVSTQKMAQFIYNRKKKGILNTDITGNYLTDNGMVEAQNTIRLYESVSGEKLVDNNQLVYRLSSDKSDKDAAKAATSIYTNNIIEHVINQLVEIRNQISSAQMSDMTFDEYDRLKKIYSDIDSIINK